MYKNKIKINYLKQDITIVLSVVQILHFECFNSPHLTLLLFLKILQAKCSAFEETGWNMKDM